MGEMMLELNKIYCMDALEGLKQLEDNSVDLIVTDPPYNILNIKNIKTKDTMVIREVDFDKEKLRIDLLIKEVCRVLKDGGSFYIFCSDRQIGKYMIEVDKNGLIYSNTLIWYYKTGHPSVRKRAFSNHAQYIAFGHKEINNKYKFNFGSQIEMRNVLEFNGAVSFEYGKAKWGKVGEWCGHPTQKPSKLIKHLIKISSDEGDLVADPYMGSGTTAIACKQLGRKFIGFEINPEYIEMGRKRLTQEVLI